jgi:hypothetical protein
MFSSSVEHALGEWECTDDEGRGAVRVAANETSQQKNQIKRTNQEVLPF